MGDYLKLQYLIRDKLEKIANELEQINEMGYHNNVFNELQRILDDRSSYVVINKQKYQELLSKASTGKRTRVQQPEIKDQPND